MMMNGTTFSKSTLFGAQDRVNANIRRAFNLILSTKGLQRPKFDHEKGGSRYVGLEFALLFYENVVQMPPIQDYLSSDVSQSSSRNDSDNNYSAEEENINDLLGENFPEYAAGTIKYLLEDGFLDSDVAGTLIDCVCQRDEKCLDPIRQFFKTKFNTETLVKLLNAFYQDKMTK